MPRSFIDLKINGKTIPVEVVPGRSLLDLLRDELALTGTKYGCGEGQCGACNVLIDGEVVRSCTVRVDGLAGNEITTIEGLARDGQLHPVQQAFLDVEAMQCGFCTPGMILAAVALLEHDPSPSDERTTEAMKGTVCRCGTYGRILAAIRRASRAMEATR